MKYIDPSGHLVVAFDEKVYAAIDLIKDVAPDLVANVNGIFDTNVFIGFLPAGEVGSICIDTGTWSTIKLDANLKDASPEWLAAKIAHELVHAIEGNFGTSAQEELIAYQTQYKVSIRLGIDMSDSWISQLSYLDPTNAKDLENARSIIKDNSNNIVYDTMPLVSLPFNEYFMYLFGGERYRDWVDSTIETYPDNPWWRDFYTYTLPPDYRDPIFIV